MEFERFVVDSNIFVAVYHEGDSNHKNALKLLSGLGRQTLIVHPYVIQETATVLTYKFGQQTAIHFLNDLDKAANVVIPFVDVKAEMQNFVALDKKLSFTDTALIGLAKKMNAGLATFDRQMLALFQD